MSARKPLMKSTFSRRGTVFLSAFFLMIYSLGTVFSAAAEPLPDHTAKDLTTSCSFKASPAETGTNSFRMMTDEKVKTCFVLGRKDSWLEIRSAEGIRGVSVMLMKKGMSDDSYDLQVEDEAEDWKTIAQSRYLSNWHELDAPAYHLRLLPTGGDRLRIAEIRLFGEGEKPDEIQDWQDTDKADLMLLACHPDDEVLWFAGLMPVYADRGYKVQLVMMTPMDGERQLELLQCAWHCGMRYYPYFIGLKDVNGQKDLERQYRLWQGKEKVHSLVTECFRKFRPEVVVTHGENGEYGHSAHKATADSAKVCLKYAADNRMFPESAEKYGVWQIKKLYLHEYDKDRVTMNWNRPLDSFGGKTGFDIAGEAFLYHLSQRVIGRYQFKPVGDHDNTAFGLYYTNVGKDTGLNDFMENIR